MWRTDCSKQGGRREKDKIAAVAMMQGRDDNDIGRARVAARREDSGHEA